LRTVFGSEFQTAGAEHRKARFANVERLTQRRSLRNSVIMKAQSPEMYNHATQILNLHLVNVMQNIAFHRCQRGTTKVIEVTRGPKLGNGIPADLVVEP